MRTKDDSGSPRQTAWVLMITILFGLALYLPKTLGQWWADFNRAETITILKPVGDSQDLNTVVGFETQIEDAIDVQRVVEQLLEGLPGIYGVWVDAGVNINSNQVFTAASVIKLPVLVAYYQAVDAGRINPDEVYVLKEADRWVYGTGSMQHQAEGAEFTYREVAQLTANQSDNMGAEVLIKKLGGYNLVQRTINGWGLTDTDLGENETTPADIGDLFARINSGELLEEVSGEELFTNLSNTVNEDRLPAGVPTGITVVHKFGSEAGVVNDCGVVLAARPYVICVLSTDINAGEAETVLPKISRVVWEWLGANE